MADSHAVRWLRFVGAYWRTNLAAVLQYRASFVSQVLGMFINDGMWLVFWTLFFARAKSVKGWDSQDVITLWACVTFAYGLKGFLAGNALRLPGLIVRGQLDYYLALPKSVLVHLLVSDVAIFDLGDALFGPLVFFLLTPLSVQRTLLFLLTGLCGAAIWVGFGVLTGSLTFWLGNAETLAFQAVQGMIHFSTFPTAIYGGVVKFLVYSVLPAAMIGAVPVRLLRHFDWAVLGWEVGFTSLFCLLSVAVFYLGLRRYESGNVIQMRGQ